MGGRGLLLILYFLSANIFAQDQLSILMGDIQNGPSTYYSPEAYSYYTRLGQTIPPQGSKDNALRCYRSAIKLGNMGNAAMAAVPVLIQKFPKAIHVSEVRNAQYSGEGSFDDWVMTYVMSDKNKFLLSSPFLDYNSISICEQQIETVHSEDFIDKQTGKGGAVIRATVNITITFSLNIGSCALEKITGISLGSDQTAWNNWWEQGGKEVLPSFSSVTPVVTSPALESGQSFSEIVVKGKYRMSLTTGDELIGTVESKDDTSLILETTDKKPYEFRKSLIKRYELLELPKTGDFGPGKEIKSAQPISFEELKKIGNTETLLEVHISNGSVFKGKLVSVIDDMLRINVEGSEIPFSVDVLTQIILLPAPKPQPEQMKPKSRGPLDTVVVKNTQTDEWGIPKPDFIYSGKITKDEAQSITMELADGTVKQIARPSILRIKKHSSDNFDEPIKRYAMQLFCPEDMFQVDLPPGKPDRPYFKVCVDRYEFPNSKDAMPRGNVSYQQAAKLCQQKGKRLCTTQEWQWACSGLEGYTYPYGWNRDENRCNTGTTPVASGSRYNCVSKFGGYDMVGNIFEWVTDSGDKPQLMGGPYSKCQTVSPGVGGSAKPQTGFRCCKSN